MKRPLLITLLFILLWGIGLSTRSITRPDEGRYAEISREITLSHNWVTPRLNAIPYFEKPPLQYWAGAISMQVLGPTPLAARLWSALMGLLGCLLVWRAGNRLLGARAGLYGALVLGSGVYYAVLGHVNSLDMGVSVWMAASLFAFLRAQVEDRRWMMAAWGAAAAALLSKGLMALVLPGITLVLYSLLTRDADLWKRLDPVRGLLILTAIAGPWFLLCASANPQFLQFFFIHEHVQRFMSTVHQRVEPAWYFIPILLAGLLPWTGQLWTALRRPFTPSETRAFSPSKFLAIYVLVVLVFFSLSGSKLPSYILPAFPALALLIGGALSHQKTFPHSPLWLGLAWAALLAFAAAVLGFPDVAAQWGIHPDVDEDMVAAYQQFAPYILAASTALLIGTVFAQRALQQPLRATVHLALAALLSTQLLLLGSDKLSDFTSSADMAQTLAPEFSAASHIYSVGTYDQTLDYYTHRTVVLVAFEDELAFGLTLEPQDAIATLRAFTPIWQQDMRALALMSPATYAHLVATGLPMRVIFEDTRRVIVARI
jgi:4-amino-4-deoxy-L-arabinose transferase-like glycosyltransferase